MNSVNKLIASNIVYDNIGKSHTFNLCRGVGYYFTIDGIEVEGVMINWGSPSLSARLAHSSYKEICENPNEVTYILNRVLGDI